MIDFIRPILTASQSPLKKTKAVSKKRGCPPEIPEILIVAPDDVRSEEDAYEEYSNIPMYIYGGATRVAGNGVPEGDGREASNRSSHSTQDAVSVEVGKMQ
jgi:hypothetical protein